MHTCFIFQICMFYKCTCVYIYIFLSLFFLTDNIDSSWQFSCMEIIRLFTEYSEHIKIPIYHIGSEYVNTVNYKEPHLVTVIIKQKLE